MTEQNTSRPDETLEELFEDVTAPSGETASVAADGCDDCAPGTTEFKRDNDYVD